jgi:hypothetical protein
MAVLNWRACWQIDGGNGMGAPSSADEEFDVDIDQVGAAVASPTGDDTCAK